MSSPSADESAQNIWRSIWFTTIEIPAETFLLISTAEVSFSWRQPAYMHSLCIQEEIEAVKDLKAKAKSSTDNGDAENMQARQRPRLAKDQAVSL